MGKGWSKFNILATILVAYQHLIIIIKICVPTDHHRWETKSAQTFSLPPPTIHEERRWTKLIDLLQCV